MGPRLLVIGTNNRAKEEALRLAASQALPGCEVRRCDAPSPVAEQPLTTEETRAGARHRARAAAAALGGWGIGMESGVVLH